MKVYGATICPDCVRAKKIMEEENIKHVYVDITEDTSKMKEFLKLRDTREEFKEIKEHGLIGIPAFAFEDGRVEFDLDILDRDRINKDTLGEEDNLPPGMCGIGGC